MAVLSPEIDLSDLQILDTGCWGLVRANLERVLSGAYNSNYKLKEFVDSLVSERPDVVSCY